MMCICVPKAAGLSPDQAGGPTTYARSHGRRKSCVVVAATEMEKKKEWWKMNPKEIVLNDIIPGAFILPFCCSYY